MNSTTFFTQNSTTKTTFLLHLRYDSVKGPNSLLAIVASQLHFKVQTLSDFLSKFQNFIAKFTSFFC